MTKTARYATEAALCDDFIAWVKASAGKYRHGEKTPMWTPFAETAGWDILLVGEDGTQIGVQAKLRFNMKVIAQSIPDRWEHWHESGPDYRAILIGEFPDGQVSQICSALGLMAMGPRAGGWNGVTEFVPGLNMDNWNGGWHYWSPKKRCPLPEFVPDVQAGASGPVQLTKWKIAALRIVATLEVRGYLTRQDFRAYGVDPRRWMGPGGWLKAGTEPGRFVRGDNLDFAAQHPLVYPQVLAEVQKKMAEEQDRTATLPGVAA